MCSFVSEGYLQLLASAFWMLNAIWEVLTLCLSVWIAVKYFRDLRRLGPLTGSAIGDCFRVLIKSHVLYFASYIILELVYSNSIGTMILIGALEVFWTVQLFVLGPRLILSVREYHTNLVAGSDAETSMTSIVFQERVHGGEKSIQVIVLQSICKTRATGRRIGHADSWLDCIPLSRMSMTRRRGVPSGEWRDGEWELQFKSVRHQGRGWLIDILDNFSLPFGASVTGRFTEFQ
ncbi:hypothetical protein BDR03DRAFT_985121 [Suillus americanus]|nr:hypothetical protein BDR03DRAFT_985121 [Suillus americanus]